MNDRTLAPYAHRLAGAIGACQESAFEDLCFDLEYDQVGKDKWPQEVFNFFTDALRNPMVCALKGSYAFVTTLRRDFDKLTSAQHSALLKVIDDNADEFGDEMLRHASSDLIARLYEPEVALSKFMHWVHQGTPRRLHMAQVGLEVLIMARRLEPGDEPKVREQLQWLWKREH